MTGAQLRVSTSIAQLASIIATSPPLTCFVSLALSNATVSISTYTHLSKLLTLMPGNVQRRVIEQAASTQAASSLQNKSGATEHQEQFSRSTAQKSTSDAQPDRFNMSTYPYSQFASHSGTQQLLPSFCSPSIPSQLPRTSAHYEDIRSRDAIAQQQPSWNQPYWPSHVAPTRFGEDVGWQDCQGFFVPSNAPPRIPKM